MGGTRGEIRASGGVGASSLPAFNLFASLWGLASSSCSPMGLAGGLLQGFCQARDPECNVVATWPYHMILLVITLNNIPLSPPIALIYHFCSWRLAFLMHQTSFINLLEIDSLSSHRWNAPSHHPYYHPTIFPFVGKRLSLIWFRWELDLLL